jgi:hypothetical protein
MMVAHAARSPLRDDSGSHRLIPSAGGTGCASACNAVSAGTLRVRCAQQQQQQRQRPKQPRPRRPAAPAAALVVATLLAAVATAKRVDAAVAEGFDLALRWTTPRICVPGSACDTSLAISLAPAAGGASGNGTAQAAGAPVATTGVVEVDWGDGSARFASAPIALGQSRARVELEAAHTYPSGLSAGPRPSAWLKLVRRPAPGRALRAPPGGKAPPTPPVEGPQPAGLVPTRRATSQQPGCPASLARSPRLSEPPASPPRRTMASASPSLTPTGRACT